VAFGHDWGPEPGPHLPLLRHLASWGFVARRPGQLPRPDPQHARFSGDLRSALDVCVGVRLGRRGDQCGQAAPGAGRHGMGGGCAVLAAADREAAGEPVARRGQLAASETRPSAIDTAPLVTAPALHLGRRPGPR